MADVRRVRDNLCSAMYNTTAMQDISESLIIERAAKLSEALVDPTQLTAGGFLLCSRYFMETLKPKSGGQNSRANFDLAVASMETKVSVMAALSLLLNGDKYGLLPDDTVDEIVAILRELALMRQSTMLPG